MIKNPIITSYKSPSDLVVLREWFYNFSKDADNRSKAIQRVKVLMTRGKLPHVVEITSLLTSVMLGDPELNENCDRYTDSNSLRLSYSMVLIRFVNGLLDPFQQSNFAIPLHQLAKNLKLPGLFVELRHMGTHEALPELDILRIASNKAINWLYENYWAQLSEEEELEESVVEISEKNRLYIESETENLKELINKITIQLKIFKKIRKLDLDLEIKQGNSSENGIKYWKAMKNIVSFYNNELTAFRLIQVLIFKNFLIYKHDKSETKGKKLKFNPLLIKLYRPLLVELGLKFKYNLLFAVLDTIHHYSLEGSHAPHINNHGNFKFRLTNGDDELDEFINSNVGFKLESDYEKIQLIAWAQFLIKDLISYNKKFSIIMAWGQKFEHKSQLINELFTRFKNGTTKDDLELLKCLKETMVSNKIEGNLLVEVNAIIDKLEAQISIESFAPPPSLDDILEPNHNTTSQKRSDNELDDENNKPKRKKQQTNYLFELCTHWQPTPFGEAP